MKVKDKVIVVTGGGNGLGREIVLNLLNKGAIVAAADINEEGLNETVKLAGENKDRLSVYDLDITDREAVEKMPQRVIDNHGSVDGLINNAGIIQPFVKVNELDYKAIDRVMNINFFGALYMTKAFLPFLLKRPVGHILNVSSMGGFLPVSGQSIYGASKAAIKLFTEGLYAELLNTNVRVTVVLPGGMDTNIAANSGVTLNSDAAENSSYKTLSPVKAADLLVEAMEKDKFRALLGSDSKTMDMLYRFNPKYATHMIYKKMKNLLKS